MLEYIEYREIIILEPIAVGKSVCVCNSIGCTPRVSYDL